MRRSSNGGSQNRLSGEAWEALYLSGHPPSSPSIHAVSKPPQQLSVSRQMMIAGAFRWQTSSSRREIRRPGDARRFCHNGRSQGVAGRCHLPPLPTASIMIPSDLGQDAALSGFRDNGQPVDAGKEGHGCRCQ